MNQARDNSIKITFKKASYSDVGFLTYLRKITMDDYLKQAGLVLTDVQHTNRVLEFFNESYLILLNEKSVGVIKLGIENSALHIRQFQILPQYQGKGLGGHVLNICKKKAREKQTSLTLNVLTNNPAQQLYLRQGFVIEATDELQHFMRCTDLTAC
ncbi:GNAT family N-acetyltransferase [Colwellia sp. MEBiC06753]